MIDRPDLDTDLDEYGRVGYGRLASYSPIMLAVIMVAAIAFIALNQRDKNDDDPGDHRQACPEPDLHQP